MSAHTPGPWRIESKTEIREVAIYAPYKGDRNCIEHVATVEDVGTIERIEANAHLIAAALEMLEALKDLSVEWLDMTPPLADSVIGRKLAVARAAIAKAEGEA